MMTSMMINNMGKPFATRQAARDWANANGGQVVDLSKRWEHFVDSQITCQNLDIPVTKTRWIVLFNRIICRPVSTKSLAKPFDRLGKTVVIDKKRYQSVLLAGERLGRIM